MRHTKIIATIGPASGSPEVIESLIRSGVDLFRLNFSHGSHEGHHQALQHVRGVAETLGRTVAVLQDLSGPKMRTGRAREPFELREGDELRIVTGDILGGPGLISTTSAELARTVNPGDRLLLDDGRIELKVVVTDGHEIVTQVVDGGVLESRKGINAPNVPLPFTALTAKDVADLQFGLEIGVDFVALSFVRRADDLERARALMIQAGRADVPLIAKLERPEAIAHLDEIFQACEGVMVARGDLGLEMPLERVPGMQKEIIHRARTQGLPVILATQVLDSMIRESRPTRAEVSDAANAVDEGVDAIMLTGETAVGAFPVRAVQVLDAVIRAAEARLPSDDLITGTASRGHDDALCKAAVTLARASGAMAVVAVTRGGNTARLLAALRPRVPVYAATETAELARRLTLLYGVFPVIVSIGEDFQAAANLIEQNLLNQKQLVSGAIIVLVSVNPDLGRPDANFLKLQKLGGSL